MFSILQLGRVASWIGFLLISTIASLALAVEPPAKPGNPFAYLSGPVDPYYVDREFPKLTTPQWTGNGDTRAVVVLAIDDMRDPAKYEAYLRPILDRLKQVEEGRAPLSIMTNEVDPNDQQLTTWIDEGVSIDVHTIDHPCPLLHGGDWAKAKSTYDRCIDLLERIPGNRPVAFRMPCCDSMNSPSPRFYETIFDAKTDAGNFLTIDSSVFVVTKPGDRRLEAELNRRIAADAEGDDRFGKYLPFPAYVNTIEDYPFPYVIGRTCWEFPCIVPSDWEAQNVLRPNNPRMVEDLKVALDVVVAKRGTLNLVFHPHGWMRNDQVVQLIDYAVATYGNQVRFMSFRDAQEAIDQHLLDGHPLRSESGADNGVRLLDVDRDGYLDVVRLTEEVIYTRNWDPEQNTWRESELAARITDNQSVQFGVLRSGAGAVMVVAESDHWRAFEFRQNEWRQFAQADSFASVVARANHDDKRPSFRLIDVDSDGICELVVGQSEPRIFRWQASKWQAATQSLPPAIPLLSRAGGDAGLRWLDVDRDGRVELVFSDAERCAAFRFTDWDRGWETLLDQRRATTNRPTLPPFVLSDGTSNGAWVHGDHLWWQNEQTARLPDKVDRLPLTAIAQGDEGAAELKAAGVVDTAGFRGAREPNEALATLSSSLDVEIQLVAHEPQVMDPVAFDWGPDGRLWVVEMRDYPFATKEGPSGCVKQLFDDDGDGHFERAQLFLDGLESPTGVKAWRDGVIISAAPNVLFARDTDGDGRADETKLLYRGFKEGNQQHRANGFTAALNGWLHMANGDSGGTVEVVATGDTVSIRGRDLRIKPDGNAAETVSGHTQFGRTRDDWGRWFGGNNSNPLIHYQLDERYISRNASYAPPSVSRSVPTFPGPAPVFPTSKTLPRFNDYDRADRITSACGHFVLNYAVDSFGDRGAIDSFVCEPVHNLVHRERLDPNGVSFVSQRYAADQKAEFLASEDNWFRPVMIKEAPDGSLWVADMYRLIIEHPEWIPKVWQEALDVRSGNDRGRIYRLVSRKRPMERTLPRLTDMSWEQLVAQLDTPNRWRRDTAQQVILWRAAKKMPSETELDALRQLLGNSKYAVAKVHSLHLLELLSSLPSQLLATQIREAAPEVARHAVRLAESRLTADEATLLPAMLSRIDTESAPLSLQLVCSLGYAKDRQAAAAIAKLVSAADDALVTSAALTSINESNLAGILDAAFGNPDCPVMFQTELAKQAVRMGDSAQRAVAIQSIADGIVETPHAAWRFETLGELLRSLALQGNQLDSLPADVAAKVAKAEAAARRLITADDVDLSARVAAVSLLRADGEERETTRSLLATLLEPRQPPELQAVAGRKLIQLDGDSAVSELVNRWAQFSPATRSVFQRELFARVELTKNLLQLARRLEVDLQLDARSRQRLLESEDLEVRSLMAELYSQIESRESVVDSFAGIDTDQADLQNGRATFKRVCSSCHQVDGVGVAVGPDLAAIGNTSQQFLLTAILDPNRAVESNYLDYRVETTDGQQYSGILIEETAVSATLLMADGKRQPILRDQIEHLQSTGRSLMPEGLEKDLTSEQMRDLIGYLQSHRPPRNRFAGNLPQIAPMRDDGSIRLLAMHAEIYGPTLAFEQKYRNLGLWYSNADFATWTVDLPREGSFEVVVQYACHDNSAGDRWSLTCRDQTITRRVEGTGTWDNYRGQGVGRIELPKGRSEIRMSAVEQPRSALIDVQQIILYPIDN